jgi:hypothetical protein
MAAIWTADPRIRQIFHGESYLMINRWWHPCIKPGMSEAVGSVLRFLRMIPPTKSLPSRQNGQGFTRPDQELWMDR